MQRAGMNTWRIAHRIIAADIPPRSAGLRLPAIQGIQNAKGGQQRKTSFPLDVIQKADQGHWRNAFILPALLGLAVGATSSTLADAGVQASPPGTAVASAAPPAGAGVGVPDDVARKKRVVVLGGTGWAGMSFLRTLAGDAYEVVAVAPRNYFLFTPLLPQVTSGVVEARSISEPIRRLLARHKKGFTFLETECVDINPHAKQVTCVDSTPQTVPGKECQVIDYDYLIIAVGAQSNTFETPGVLEYTHRLKEVDDAERIRENIVDCFETAVLPSVSDEDRKRLLHFVVVGGGPTGVEFAAELHDLVKDDLSKIYPEVAGLVKITLIQSGDHILNMFDKRISDFAVDKFSRDGVEVRCNARVMGVTGSEVTIMDKTSKKKETMEHGLIVWSTGIGTRPVITKMMKVVGQSDRRVLATDEWLRVKGCVDVWALGDCATIEYRRMQEDISLLFKMADTKNSGFLTLDQFQQQLEKVKERYPQIQLYLKRQKFRDLLKDFHPEADGQGESLVKLRIEDFEKALREVDSQMKTLPATAQVAAQQGEYLGVCFNKMANPNHIPEGPSRVRGSGQHKFHPFQYRHFGQFAPLGGGAAGAELPADWVSVGRSSQWLWYSVYASKQVSWRTRFLVVFDWTKCAIFGRDSSRM